MCNGMSSIYCYQFQYYDLAVYKLLGEQLSSNFREQLSGAALKNSFGEPFWGMGLENRSFGAIVLDSSFGEQLPKLQLSGTALQNGFGEPFW